MTFEVSAAQSGSRLDAFLSQSLSWSRRQAQTAIAAGRVRVNGQRARKGIELQAGDSVSLEDEVLVASTLTPNPELDIAVLYEDSQVVALDKPAGIPSLALRADEHDTVANFLLARYPETATIGRSPLEPGIVHRLDTGTSGILLVARTPEAYEDLREQFQRRRVEKEYVAVVEGNVREPASIQAPLIEHPRDARRMKIADPGAEGARRASTSYRPLESRRERSLLAVKIKTGARHQIRVHLAEIGHPIVGDRLYGNPDQRDLGRHLLHACYLAFDHPTSKQRLEVRSAPPREFSAHLSHRRDAKSRRQG